MYLVHHNCDKLLLKCSDWIHENSLIEQIDLRDACLPVQGPATTVEMSGH